jgi:DUF1680 family protein
MKITLQDEFLLRKVALVREVVLPYQWEILNDRVPDAPVSHCIKNFLLAAGESTESHYGVVFLDSDLYKWLEGVSYTLMHFKDEALLKNAEYAIALIGRAQMPDGYINTWYQTKEKGKRWSDLAWGHELYCAGHLFEAAAAHHQATGQDSLLSIACRFADHICKTFAKSAKYPGHPEVELGLIKLCQETGIERYLEQAQCFLDARGKDAGALMLAKQEKPIFDDVSTFGPDYFQAHEPVREQRNAEGHAVRAVYLFSAMADYAAITGDKEMEAACKALYKSITNRRMYITGAIGSSAIGERFTADWDLPNDSAYAESCASVGLMGFSRRMWDLTKDPGCIDTFERAFYNTVLSGISEDGKHFFYVNPLEVTPSSCKANPSLAHVKTVRQKWFGVACCPPNIARCITSLHKNIFVLTDSSNDKEKQLFVLLHIASSFETPSLKGQLDKNGEIYTLYLTGEPAEVLIRIPENTIFMECKTASRYDKGYFVHYHSSGSEAIIYCLEEQIVITRANEHVAACSNKACIQKGLTVYCAEEADNGSCLGNLRVCDDSTIHSCNDQSLEVDGYRPSEDSKSDKLFFGEKLEYDKAKIRLIPYRNWNNRGEGEMRVWLNTINKPLTK